MNSDVLAFHVSDVRVEIEVAPGACRSGLEAVWRHARPVVPATRTVRGGVGRAGAHGEVWLGERHMLVDADDVLPAIEKLVYDSLAEWHEPSRVLLHAAAVVLGDHPVVLAGPSGSGKSSLSLALVRRGARYLTDEIVVTDGPRLWGIPRAPQFEPIAEGAVLPRRLSEADVTSYRYRSDGGWRALPIARLDDASIHGVPCTAPPVLLVFPEVHATGAPRRVPHGEALSRLLAEVRSTAAVDLGAWVARSWALPWSEAESAVRWIETATDAPSL